jgi:hypothetical protein
MRVAGKLICESYVLTPGRGAVPVDQMGERERALWLESMRRRLSAGMSDYYTQHPEQFKRL